jgi:putative transposase
MGKLSERRRLYHVPPAWVESSSLYFVTICCERRGVNQLCLPKTGDSLLESAAFYHERQRWWIDTFLLMPDHMHALLAFPKTEYLGTVARMWKGYQTKRLGIGWQEGFFDHRIRSNESAGEKRDYIRMNPVRAGLVASVEDWPYVLVAGVRPAARPEDSPYL